MNEIYSVYLLQNQNKLFLSKDKEWVDATDLSVLYRTPYKDEALNLLVEVNSKDIDLRIHCVECETGAQKLPVIDPAIMPEPLPKPEPLPTQESSPDSEPAPESDLTQDTILEAADAHFGSEGSYSSSDNVTEVEEQQPALMD